MFAGDAFERFLDRQLGEQADLCRHCHALGFNSTGVWQCRFKTGCKSPAPRICEQDAIAWFIFDGLRKRPGRWDWVVGPTVMKRMGLKLEAVREYAAFHGIEVDGDLLDRIEVCEAWLLDRDAKRVEPPPGDEEVVN